MKPRSHASRRLFPILAIAPILAASACSAGDDATSSSDLTEGDLEGREFIHSETYKDAPAFESGRDGVELEGIAGFTCSGGASLLDVLRAERGGKTTYQRLRRAESMEAFSAEYGADEMPWSEDAHQIREASPFVWLSIEGSRYAVEPESGRRELSVGTDIMDDTYYDTPDFILDDNEMAVRGRARWDTPTEIRRILIGAKVGSSVDAAGIKSAAKRDIRNNDASKKDVERLDRDVRRGFTEWEGFESPADPVREIYESLAKGKKLPDVKRANGSAFKKVLLLEQKAKLRSVRSRYHLNEASLFGVGKLHELGRTRLETILARISEARTANRALPPAAAAFETKAKAFLDGSLIAERASAGMKKVKSDADVGVAAVTKLLPDSNEHTVSDEALELRRVVAETESAIAHELGKELDALRAPLAGVQNAGLDAHVERFREWINESRRPSLGLNDVAETRVLRTLDRFVDVHAKILALSSGDRAEQLKAYNAFGEKQRADGDGDFKDFAPLDAAAFGELGANLRSAQMLVWKRQIEAAGSAAIGLWFDVARSHWVPRSFRTTDNFLIDTMDMTEMLTPKSWESISAKDRAPDQVLPKDKVFHVVLVNELQIELGQEKAYTDRVNDLEKAPKSAKRDRELEGAKFVFGKYQEMLTRLAQLKAPEVVRRLEDAGGTGCKGEEIEASKGDQAIERVRKMGKNP